EQGRQSEMMQENLEVVDAVGNRARRVAPLLQGSLVLQQVGAADPLDRHALDMCGWVLQVVFQGAPLLRGVLPLISGFKEGEQRFAVRRQRLGGLVRFRLCDVVRYAVQERAAGSWDGAEPCS